MDNKVTAIDSVRNVLQTMAPIKSLLPDHLAELLRNAEQYHAFSGDTIFSEGRYDDWVYYLVHGQVELSGEGQHAQRIDAAELFHPLAEVQPRRLTAKAVTDCYLIKVLRAQQDALLTWSQVAEFLLADFGLRRDLDEDIHWINTILKSNLFIKVPPINADLILTSMQPKVVNAGEVVIRQGELGDRCYFIKEGQAEVTRQHNNEVEVLASIGPGRCFGEDALIHDTVRNATVTFTTDAVVMVLLKEDFLELLKTPEVHGVSYSEMAKLQSEGAILIDVRLEEEYTEGHLEMAVNLPLNLLLLKSRMLPKDSLLITCCQSGSRSRAAAFLLEKLGYSARVLEGGFEANSRNIAGFTQQDFYLQGGQILSGQD